nr:leucine-rich repeat receptor protein kinase EMS1-like [Ipomoea trifida]
MERLQKQATMIIEKKKRQNSDVASFPNLAGMESAATRNSEAFIPFPFPSQAKPNPTPTQRDHREKINLSTLGEELKVYCIFMGVPLLLQVLVAIGSFLILTTIAAFVLVLCRISAKRRYQRRLSSASVPESVTFDPTDLNRIEMGELIIATKDFSPELIIGDGSFGLVYKAKLSSGLQVAVKKLSADAFQGFREFQAEMDTLGKIRHPNIVKMFGYCSTGLDRVLIYELVKNGSLDQWLYYTSGENGQETRLVEWASNMVSQNRYNEIIDSSLSKHDIKENDLTHYFNIAIMCSSEAPKARPAMNDAIMMLNQLST